MTEVVQPVHRAPFVHEALVYAGMEDFVEGTLPFIREGLDSGEPVLVAVGREKIARLRSEVGADDGRVTFVDMAEVGRNPARILPVWLDFTAAAAGTPCRGIGEPIWPGRSAPERAEGHRHEHLLNVAFRDTRGLRILCPYDAVGLDADDVEQARRSHSAVRRGHVREESPSYAGLEGITMLDDALPDPPADADELLVSAPADLAGLRRWVAAQGERAGLAEPTVVDLVQAASELAANSLRYGGGRALVRSWREDGTLICEVRDRGRIGDLLVGRVRPTPEQIGGRGLWMVNQLADLVELRSSDAGTVVRLHARRP